MQHLLFKWFLYRVYSGKLCKFFSVLQPGSEAFENEYKEQRYKIVESIPSEHYRKFMKLMALDVGYLSRKSHDSINEKKNLIIKGRIMQASYEYALFDLVHIVKQKEQSKKLDKKTKV